MNENDTKRILHAAAILQRLTTSERQVVLKICGWTRDAQKRELERMIDPIEDRKPSGLTFKELRTSAIIATLQQTKATYPALNSGEVSADLAMFTLGEIAAKNPASPAGEFFYTRTANQTAAFKTEWRRAAYNEDVRKRTKELQAEADARARSEKLRARSEEPIDLEDENRKWTEWGKKFT